MENEIQKKDYLTVDFLLDFYAKQFENAKEILEIDKELEKEYDEYSEFCVAKKLEKKFKPFGNECV